MSSLFKTLLVTLLALFALGAVQAKELTPEQLPGTTRISAEDIFNLVEKYDDLVIIDARKNSDREKGYIEGSVGLPDTETNEASLAKTIASKDTPVVFYCNGEKCGRSVTASKIAVKLGYKNIYWFRGGWEEWMAKGMPVTK